MAISPFEELQFQNRADDLRQQTGSQLAQNQYQYDMLKNRRTRDLGNLSGQYNNPYTGLWQRLPGGFAQRGLLKSGIYNQARTELAIQQQRDLSDLELGYGEQFGQLDLNRKQSESQLASGLGRIEAERNAARAAAAAHIRSVL